MFSVSEDVSGGLYRRGSCPGVLRRAHAESTSIVAPVNLVGVDFLASSL